ncbi:MAG TPA: transcriptional regulator, partial [Treponema sp.]|nr:transcriptional regulator [Treponema sp.]HRS05367.1 transcriptional regulator [Treponema sp.]HRU29932.1 transcriptional regulator [Treponema sp.]
RSYRYFKRTIRNVVMYRDEIDGKLNQAKVRGCTTVLLIGVSDLDFIIEHCCLRHGLTYLKVVDLKTAHPLYSGDYFIIFSETISPPPGLPKPNQLYLLTLLSGSGELHG